MKGKRIAVFGADKLAGKKVAFVGEMPYVMVNSAQFARDAGGVAVDPNKQEPDLLVVGEGKAEFVPDRHRVRPNGRRVHGR